MSLVYRTKFNLGSWTNLGWDLALTSSVLLDSVSLTFYVLQALPILGIFPKWFFVKWAQLDRLNSVMFSKVYLIIMICMVDSTIMNLIRLVSYVGVNYGINLL